MLLNTYHQHAATSEGKAPLVFLHGLFGQGRNFRTLQRQLCHDRDVYALDLRNFGRSPHGPMNYPIMAEDVTQTLMQDHALPAIIAGHSMGGKVGMTLALAAPQHVRALIVVDIPPAPTKKSAMGIDPKVKDITFGDYLDLHGADQLLTKTIPDPQIRQVMIQNIVRGKHPHWRIGMNNIYADMDRIMGWPQQWAQGRIYEGPTLFIRAEHSPYIREEHMEKIKKFFPRAEHVTIPDCGHWVHAQAPKAFCTCLQHFISRIDP